MERLRFGRTARTIMDASSRCREGRLTELSGRQKHDVARINVVAG